MQHIDDFEIKRKEGSVTLRHAASGRVMVLEETENPVTGLKTMQPVQERTSAAIDEMIANAEQQIVPLQKRIEDLKAERKAVAEMEAAWAKAEEKTAAKAAKGEEQ